MLGRKSGRSVAAGLFLSVASCASAPRYVYHREVTPAVREMLAARLTESVRMQADLWKMVNRYSELYMRANRKRREEEYAGYLEIRTAYYGAWMELESHRHWLLDANGVGLHSVDPLNQWNLEHQISGMAVRRARDLAQWAELLPARERQQAQKAADPRSLKLPEDIKVQLATANAVQTSVTQYQIRVLDDLLVAMGKPTSAQRIATDDAEAARINKFYRERRARIEANDHMAPAIFLLMLFGSALAQSTVSPADAKKQFEELDRAARMECALRGGTYWSFSSHVIGTCSR